MFPLYDDKKKNIIFWSFKCGCTYIRNIYYNLYLKLNYKKNIIKIITLFNRFNKLDSNKLLEYRKIYICRNPYSRIVSCFIDKYIDNRFSKWFQLSICIKNFFRYFENKNYLRPTFKEFINLVYEKFVLKQYSLLEYDHLTPQFTINYNNNFKFDKIYKLEDLNSSTFLKDEFDIKENIENAEQKTSLHNNNCSNSEYCIENAFNLEYNELLELKKSKKIPNYKYFFNEELKYKVNEIYKTDFTNLLEYNINYDL
jgi:hypothetical protein